MKRTLMIAILPAVIVGFVFGNTVTCGAQSPSNREDEEAIKKVIFGTTQAFNKHDAKELTRFYTPDAELVTGLGERMRGTAEIERGLAAIFATRARAATLKTLEVTIRFIRPDVAVAQVTNEMSGMVSAKGERLPSQQELSTRVLVKDKGTWRVTALHITILNPVRSPAR